MFKFKKILLAGRLPYLQIISFLPYYIGPFLGTFRFVKGLPGYCFAEIKFDVLAPLFEHLVGQVEHLDIHLNTKTLPYLRQVIEKGTVTARKKTGHNITLILYGLYNETLLPLK